MGWGVPLFTLASALVSACNAQISGASGDRMMPDAAAAADSALPDAPVTLGPWSTPAIIPPAALSTANEDDDTLSANALEMIFAIEGTSGKDLFYTARSSATADWSTAVTVPFNSPQSDETPRLSDDGLTLFFASGRAGHGNLDIWSVQRTALDNTTWGMPQPMLNIGTDTLLEKWFMPCGTDRYVMVQATASNGTDLVEGSLAGGTPAAVTELNSPQNETGTFVSRDCLTIYFASNRPSSASPTKIYTSHRASLTSPWVMPSVVVDFPIPGSTAGQEDPWRSEDGRTFVFASDAAGTRDIYISTR
jgi:hypothetical protein